MRIKERLLSHEEDDMLRLCEESHKGSSRRGNYDELRGMVDCGV